MGSWGEKNQEAHLVTSTYPRWWFQRFFWSFTPKHGEMIQFDLRIFFIHGLLQPPTSINTKSGWWFETCFFHPETWGLMIQFYDLWSFFEWWKNHRLGKVSLDLFLWRFLFTYPIGPIALKKFTYIWLNEGKITIWNHHFYPMKSPNLYLHHCEARESAEVRDVPVPLVRA